ncbi:MAG TPA: Uma2 family endonuclease [Thermomicrobiales bacterium]|nr:Uma2 family endonuclease [Thermomicrobiales bacterium]
MSVTRQEQRLMTAEELWELPERPGVRYELVKGALVEVPGAGGVHAQLIVNLLLLLHPFVTGRGLGRVFGDGLAYIIKRGPDVVRIPDASFVSEARLPAGGIPAGFWPGAPDLAVEVVSPNDRAEDLHDKARDYLEAGARLVWVLWPHRRAVSVHEPGGAIRELGPDDELGGGDVLPGFRVRVADLFEVGR